MDLKTLIRFVPVGLSLILGISVLLFGICLFSFYDKPHLPYRRHVLKQKSCEKELRIYYDEAEKFGVLHQSKLEAWEYCRDNNLIMSSASFAIIESISYFITTFFIFWRKHEVAAFIFGCIFLMSAVSIVLPFAMREQDFGIGIDPELQCQNEVEKYLQVPIVGIKDFYDLLPENKTVNLLSNEHDASAKDVNPRSEANMIPNSGVSVSSTNSSETKTIEIEQFIESNNGTNETIATTVQPEPEGPSQLYVCWKGGSHQFHQIPDDFMEKSAEYVGMYKSAVGFLIVTFISIIVSLGLAGLEIFMIHREISESNTNILKDS